MITLATPIIDPNFTEIATVNVTSCYLLLKHTINTHMTAKIILYISQFGFTMSVINCLRNGLLCQAGLTINGLEQETELGSMVVPGESKQ